MQHFPEIDLTNPDNFVAGTPHAWFRKLRAEEPVYFHPEKDGPGFYCITRYDDLKEISRKPKVFSSYAGGTLLEEMPEEDLAGMRLIMINMDPPQHVKFRRTVQRGFTPKLVEDLRPHVRDLSRKIVDNVARKGECEFVEHLAAELPLQVICEMVGVPQEDRHYLYEVSNRLIGFDDPDFTTSQEDGKIAAAEVFAYAIQLAQKYLERPNAENTLVHKLLTGEVDGEKLTEAEFSSFFMLLMIAGNETTRTVTSWGMHALMEHPDQRDRLAADPSLIPSAVEEILRFNPAVHYFRRQVMEDTEIRGVPLPAGSKLALWYPSVNRDESVFEDPDTFDITRSPNNHLSFGIGEHFCLGANLARMELQEIFREILSRLPDMQLSAPPRRLRSNFINGCKEMHVHFTPEA